MSRKRRAKALSKKDEDIQFLQQVLDNNGIAMTDTRKKKSWTKHDLKNITPLNTPQQLMFEAYFEGNNIIADGSAGTGKSLAALYLALNDVLDKNQPQQRIIIVRSAVSTRDLGHLPGDVNDKLEPYEVPYRDMIGFLMGRKNAYDDMKDAGLIHFMPTSFVRGLTWDDSIIIVDELQNMNFPEISSVMTRVGDNSRIIAIGDYLQSDLIKSGHDKSGINVFLDIASRISNFNQITFAKEDVIRSGFVRDWIYALEEVIAV